MKMFNEAGQEAQQPNEGKTITFTNGNMINTNKIKEEDKLVGGPNLFDISSPVAPKPDVMKYYYQKCLEEPHIEWRHYMRSIRMDLYPVEIEDDVLWDYWYLQHLDW